MHERLNDLIPVDLAQSDCKDLQSKLYTFTFLILLNLIAKQKAQFPDLPPGDSSPRIKFQFFILFYKLLLCFCQCEISFSLTSSDDKRFL